MATATPESVTIRPVRPDDAASEAAVTAVGVFEDGGRLYRCPCGHVLRVFGGGRHRVYFESYGGRLDEPVMNGVCPTCGRGLPGKNPS